MSQQKGNDPKTRERRKLKYKTDVHTKNKDLAYYPVGKKSGLKMKALWYHGPTSTFAVRVSNSPRSQDMGIVGRYLFAKWRNTFPFIDCVPCTRTNPVPRTFSISPSASVIGDIEYSTDNGGAWVAVITRQRKTGKPRIFFC